MVLCFYSAFGFIHNNLSAHIYDFKNPDKAIIVIPSDNEEVQFFQKSDMHYTFVKYLFCDNVINDFGEIKYNLKDCQVMGPSLQEIKDTLQSKDKMPFGEYKNFVSKLLHLKYPNLSEKGHSKRLGNVIKWLKDPRIKFT